MVIVETMLASPWYQLTLGTAVLAYIFIDCLANLSRVR